MHPDAFDVLLMAVTVLLILAGARAVYKLGVEDGWQQSGEWADKHYPLDIGPDDRAAARHDADDVRERTYPYRGEVD